MHRADLGAMLGAGRSGLCPPTHANLLLGSSMSLSLTVIAILLQGCFHVAAQQPVLYTVQESMNLLSLDNMVSFHQMQSAYVFAWTKLMPNSVNACVL